jgi:hypothetical protein
MALLPARPIADPTLDAVREAVEAHAATERVRPYLGMSAIGEPCERKLWYSFRWCVREKFTTDQLWRFEDGHRSEDVMAARLRLVPGVHLMTIDPRSGQQFEYVDLGGHFRGHSDGLITGLLQAPKALHVWEAKATDEAKHAKLVELKIEGEKTALKQWDGVYYAQAVMYMAYAEATRHYLTASTSGARAWIGVRTDTNLHFANLLREKAERVIKSKVPLTRISDKAELYLCKWCVAQWICHGSEMPAVNCRTCAHATPEMDTASGRWSCARWNKNLTPDDQRAGCPSHRYIPALVKFGEAVDADEEANWIEYQMRDGRTFRNGGAGPNAYTSDELRVIQPAMIGDPAAAALRAAFDGRHVELSPA